MGKNEYRIKELNGSFTIEIREITCSGMFWWYREEESWSKATIVDSNLSPTFKSLEDAKAQVGIWIKEQTYKKRLEPIYHYV